VDTVIKINIESIKAMFKKKVVVSDAKTPEGIARDAKAVKSLIDTVKSFDQGLTEENIPLAILLVTALGMLSYPICYVAHISWAMPLVLILPILYMVKVRMDMNTVNEWNID
jgi:hypothetical protein